MFYEWNLHGYLTLKIYLPRAREANRRVCYQKTIAIRLHNRLHNMQKSAFGPGMSATNDGRIVRINQPIPGIAPPNQWRTRVHAYVRLW